jgi:hypothetical protein
VPKNLHFRSGAVLAVGFTVAFSFPAITLTAIPPQAAPGQNWHANLMGLKFLNAQEAGTLADAVNAIDFAIQAKAAFSAGGANIRVLSNSWSGGGFSQALLERPR